LNAVRALTHQPAMGAEFSTWQKILGEQSLVEAVRAAQLPGIPLVSVGSGNGVTERQVGEALKTDVICVDPDSFSYAPESENGMLPDFPHVEALLEKKKELVGDCLLMLVWTDPNDSTYDVEAIELLRPRSIVVVCEITGSGGSSALHEWMQKLPGVGDLYDGPVSWLTPPDEPAKIRDKYRISDIHAKMCGETAKYAIVTIRRVD